MRENGKGKYVKYRIYRNLLLMLFLFSIASNSFSQHKFRHDRNDISSFTYGARDRNGFRITMSLVAMFTAGAADRNGMRIGAGVTLSQTADNWTFSVGGDAYKATQNFGVGTSFAGVSFDDSRYGAAYYVNKYYQGDKQISGMIRLHLDDFRIHFEDDILALPFTGFKVYDRYRTAALELQYKHFLVGTNVYTTDIDGMTDASLVNSRGVYRSGKQISSPIFAGYAGEGMIIRYGFNNKIGGSAGQNGWHRLFFNTPDFETGSYKNQFFQVGVNKPYTLY